MTWERADDSTRSFLYIKTEKGIAILRNLCYNKLIQ